MLRLLSLIFFVLWMRATPLHAQQAFKDAESLQRRYADGTVSHYLMTGDNDGWKYTIRATDTVKGDANGRYYEEIGWSDLTSNAQQKLTPASLAFRQTVSLDDPASYMKVPDLANVQPVLIGPITDTLTFYSDLLLAERAKLVKPGQTAYVSRTSPNSWADGQRVLLGQDIVDFSLTVESVNPAYRNLAYSACTPSCASRGAACQVDAGDRIDRTKQLRSGLQGRQRLHRGDWQGGL